ncbi:MAG TPA: protein TolR [Coxiellaceae bacterium]|nr:protein TolR [Coxiellaceae bacterium]
MQITKKKKPMAEINVVPYIDVMLVLLVIFMITTPLLSQGVHVELPNAAAKALSAEELPPLIVSVDKEGNYYLNINKDPEVVISPDELSQQVSNALSEAQAKNQKREVYVKGDQSANYGQIVQAMVLLQKAGAPSVGLMTEDRTSSSKM